MWATMMARSLANDSVIDGKGQQRGPRVSRYEACRMEEMDCIIATEGSGIGKHDD